MQIAEAPAWKALLDHAENLSNTSLLDLFDADAERGSRFNASHNGLHFDYSKNLLTQQTLSLLFDLAAQAGLAPAIEKLFLGDLVNPTENRPALHTALRGAAGVDGDAGIERAVNATLKQLTEFADAVHQGRQTSSTGQAFHSIVNIGIGGSDFGPQLVVKAFPALYPANIRPHFVSNIDTDALTAVLAHCEPQSTLFIVSSKSFATTETLANATLARTWLREHGIAENKLMCHFVAATGNVEAAAKWGFESAHIFPMGQWVGGRFSLWSAIGLPIALSLGSAAFLELLAGARDLDKHFRHTAFASNLPVLHGLLNIWSINFQGYRSKAVLAYVHRLRLLPDYLQQLVMESLGKSTTTANKQTSIATSPVVWGSEETNGQHSFHQFLLQGTEVVPVEFIATRTAHCSTQAHRELIANCIAQSRALLCGKSTATAEAELIAAGHTRKLARQLAPHKAVPGNRPSNTLLLEALTPFHLGALLAFYEHSVYVQSVIWGINCFDQWGVELGKTIGGELSELLAAGAPAGPEQQHLDSSTQNLLKLYRGD